MRLFVALDIDEGIRREIGAFLDQVREFFPEARWVRVESLHVTLEFLGEKSSEEVEQITAALSSIDFAAVEMNIRGYGFFPSERAARVFWIGIEAGVNLASLARLVREKTALQGKQSEEHEYYPHLTLARGAGRSGAPGWRKGDKANCSFRRLQESLSAMPAPEFGTMMAREFFLYQSRLSAGGSQYTKLAAFPLRHSRLP